LSSVFANIFKIHFQAEVLFKFTEVCKRSARAGQAFTDFSIKETSYRLWGKIKGVQPNANIPSTSHRGKVG
jgi:hypothetical protein